MVKEVSNMPEQKILDWFEITSIICLSFAGLIAVMIFSGWHLPVITSILPAGWAQMQASTALAVIFICIGLSLNMRRENVYFLRAKRFLAGAAIFLAVMAFYEHWYSQGAVFGKYLVSADMSSEAYPMSMQSASCFMLLGLLMLIGQTLNSRLCYVADMLIFTLITLNLLFLSGYLFKASNLIGQSSVVLISPQTLVCVALLSFVKLGYRAPYGFFSVLVARGIGSKFARIILPYSIIISYMVILTEKHLLNSGSLSSPYEAAALTATTLAALLVVVIILMAKKINVLEIDLRNMSLNDELTGILNRRGLYVHGEQELRDARRSMKSLTLFFFDLDGLKKVNDTLGHDVGSQLLCDFSRLLDENFRDSDIISRLGGDEFVVISHGGRDEMVSALRRLYDSAKVINKTENKPYTIGFSVGEVVFDPKSDVSLDDLVVQADEAMYQNKKERRAGRERIESLDIVVA